MKDSMIGVPRRPAPTIEHIFVDNGLPLPLGDGLDFEIRDVFDRFTLIAKHYIRGTGPYEGEVSPDQESKRVHELVARYYQKVLSLEVESDGDDFVIKGMTPFISFGDDLTY